MLIARSRHALPAWPSSVNRDSSRISGSGTNARLKAAEELHNVNIAQRSGIGRLRTHEVVSVALLGLYPLVPKPFKVAHRVALGPALEHATLLHG